MIAQERQGRAVSAARIQEMQNERHWIEQRLNELRIVVSAIEQMNDRLHTLDAIILAEKNQWSSNFDYATGCKGHLEFEEDKP